MYINFINDRQKLGFNCNKDINSIKQLKRTLKTPVTWIIKKGKRTVIFLFSNEILVGVFIFFSKPSYIEPNVEPTSIIASEVYQSYVMKSDNLRVLNSPPTISDFILRLRGGSDQLTDEEQDRLVKSILAKTPQSDYSEISINKFIKKILEVIDPVISNQRFWRILSEFEKPVKLNISGPTEFSSTDILKSSASNNQAKTRSKGSSYFYAEALNIPNSNNRKNPNSCNNPDSYNTLEPSGLSRNHKQLSNEDQFIENRTKLRRAQPLSSSKALGKLYKYSSEQLKIKAQAHIKDFGVSTQGKTVEQMAIEYKDLLETMLSKPNLIIRKDGTLSKLEATINIGDPESLGIVAFENNPLYEDYHFISGYILSKDRFEKFNETGNIGRSREEKTQEITASKTTKSQAKREKALERLFYQKLPKDARMSNRDLREAEAFKNQENQDKLTEPQKQQIQRAERYYKAKTHFDQHIAPHIPEDDF